MVFTDLDMPKLDGFGLLGRMRKSDDARIKALPVVVISGNEEPSSKQRARDLGANDFIAKSADAPEVLSRLDNVLRLVRASQELEQTTAAVASTATHDPLTGTHTPHYLVTEGRKHFAHARRHSGELSVMALRLDTYEAIALAASKDIAELVRHAHRQAGDREGARRRLGGAHGAGDLRGARRQHRGRAHGGARRAPAPRAGRGAGHLPRAAAQVRHQHRRGLDLVRSGRLDRGPGAARDAAPAGDPARPAPAPPRPGIPDDLERVLRFLENLDASRLGDAAEQFAKRLKRISKAIQARKK